MTADSTRAVGLFAFGGAEVLAVVERNVPGVRADKVRIRIKAAAVNPTDLVLRAGERAALLAEFTPP